MKQGLILFLLFNCLLWVSQSQTCTNFGADNSGNVVCVNQQTDVPPNQEVRRWQTPPRGDATHKESFQDMSHLVG